MRQLKEEKRLKYRKLEREGEKEREVECERRKLKENLIIGVS